MTPTPKQLKKQIDDYHEENLKLKRELREVCCNRNTPYSIMIKSRERYHYYLEYQNIDIMVF